MFNRVAQMMQENRESIFNNLSRPQGADVDVVGILGAMPMFRNAANRQSRGMFGGALDAMSQVSGAVGGPLNNASEQGTGNMAGIASAVIDSVFGGGRSSPFGGGSARNRTGLMGRAIGDAVQNSGSGGLFGNVAQRGGPGGLLGNVAGAVSQAVQGSIGQR